MFAGREDTCMNFISYSIEKIGFFFILYGGTCHGIVKSQTVFTLFGGKVEPRKWLC